MENSCRLCLSNAFDLSSVFQFKNGLLVVDLIKNVVPEITIVRSDRLSKLICGTCLDGVVSAYDLRTISIENDKKMQLEMQDVRHYLNFEVKAEPDDSLVKDEEFYDDYHAGDGSDDYQNISKMYDLKEVSVVLNRNEADQASSTDQIKAEFTCIYCASSFYEPTLLVDHVAQDHNINSKDLVCDICNKQGNFKIFKTKTKIAEHMALCHTESGTTKALSKKAKEKHEEIKCEYCPQLFKTQSARYAHKKRKHSNENTWKQCSECPLRFRSQNKFEVHVRRKHDKTPKKTTKCDICLEVFKSYADLKLHSYIHVDYVEKFHPSEPHLYSCSLCGFYCYNDAELQVHLQTHQGDFKTKKIIVCVKCSWTFKDFDFLVAHTKKHNEIPTHRCLKCLKTFVFGKKLLKHLQKYQEAFVCDVCGHVESIKLRLEQHIRCVHMKEVFFLCPTCGVSKKSNVALKSHMQVHHSTEMKYKCLLCPKVFRTPAYYRNHQSVHSNEANFQCQKCPKRFKGYRNLRRHQRFHEPTKLVYRFACEYCEKRFYSNYAVKRHTLIHTGVRPWICDFPGCDRSFSQSNDLNNHMRSHIGECTYRCEFPGCTQAFKLKSDLRIHGSDHYLHTEKKPEQM